MQEQSIASGGVIDYIATLCGIIGGTITVLGYIVNCYAFCSESITINSVSNWYYYYSVCVLFDRLLKGCLQQSTKTIMGKSD